MLRSLIDHFTFVLHSSLAWHQQLILGETLILYLHSSPRFFIHDQLLPYLKEITFVLRAPHFHFSFDYIQQV